MIEKKDVLKNNPTTPEQRKRISNLYGKYGIKIDYRWFDFYNYIKESPNDIEYYLPHDIYFNKIDPYFSEPFLSKVIDDKNYYDIYFFDIKRPKTIIRKINGLILDNQYNIITLDEALSLCRSEDNIIIKPSVMSEGGRGITFWNSKEDDLSVITNIISSSQNIIVSEVVRQCNEFNKIHASSLNTIRIMTLLINDEVNIISCILRMGINGSKLDNASLGGIFCGINSDGSLKEEAYTISGIKYTAHPQGGILSQYKVPNFDKCINIVKSLAPRMYKYSRLCSWDLCIDENDMPQLIEVNLSFGGIELHQITNGPIFKNKISEILDLVYKK